MEGVAKPLAGIDYPRTFTEFDKFFSAEAVCRVRNRIKLIIDSQMVITESHGGDQVAERSDAGRCVV